MHAPKTRIEFSGAFCHALTRGNQKQRVFRNPADFQKYLQVLAIYKNRIGCRIYAYVLMINHVHVLIETGVTPIAFMNKRTCSDLFSGKGFVSPISRKYRSHIR